MQWGLSDNADQNLLMRVHDGAIAPGGSLDGIYVVATRMKMSSNHLAIGFWNFCITSRRRQYILQGVSGAGLPECNVHMKLGWNMLLS